MILGEENDTSRAAEEEQAAYRALAAASAAMANLPTEDEELSQREVKIALARAFAAVKKSEQLSDAALKAAHGDRAYVDLDYPVIVASAFWAIRNGIDAVHPYSKAGTELAQYGSACCAIHALGEALFMVSLDDLQPTGAFFDAALLEAVQKAE